ncbi:MAG: hypothetical protein ACW99Q_19590 [Candidatus Kariarchaeaceae archaeon]|jgi:hypothetical protein
MSALMPIKKRGAIAIRNSESSWTGVFKADGAQPVIFGEDIWERLQDNWKCLVRWGKDLLSYGDWADYLRDGQCPYCGKYGLGQPFRAHMEVMTQFDEGILAPDIECKRHSHIPPMPSVLSQNEKLDGLWVEWIYVVDPLNYTLEVLKSVRDKGTTPFTGQDGRKWKQPNYRYLSVELFSLFGNEPDWEKVQAKGVGMSGYYHKKYTECQMHNFLNLS